MGSPWGPWGPLWLQRLFAMLARKLLKQSVSGPHKQRPDSRVHGIVSNGTFEAGTLSYDFVGIWPGLEWRPCGALLARIRSRFSPPCPGVRVTRFLQKGYQGQSSKPSLERQTA